MLHGVVESFLCSVVCCDNAKAMVEWASSAIKYSHEAQFVISSLTDEVIMRPRYESDERGFESALQTVYSSSVNSQSLWQAYLINQRAVDLMEDVDEESEDAG